MKKYIHSFVSVFAVAAAVWLSGCGEDECPVCPPDDCEPQRYDGRLYVSMEAPNPNIYVFDTMTDSLIDSILFPYSVGVAVSADGRYLASSSPVQGVTVYNAHNLEAVANLPIYGSVEFAKSHDPLVFTGTPGIQVYSIPDLALRREWAISLAQPARVNARGNRLYTTRFDPDDDTLYVFDVDSNRVFRKQLVNLGIDFLFQRIDISADERLLYALIRSEWAKFIVYDLEADSLIDSLSLFSFLGGLDVHPNGKEVWITDPGDPFYYFWGERLMVFDTHRGRHLYTVNMTQASSPYAGFVPDARHLAFTPNGAAAYVGCGTEFSESGTVFRVDFATKRVTKVLFPLWDRYPIDMAIGPKPIQ